MKIEELLPELVNKYGTDPRIKKSVHWNAHLYYTIHVSHEVAKSNPLKFDMRDGLWDRPDRLLFCAYLKTFFDNKFSPVKSVREVLFLCKNALEETHLKNANIDLLKGLKIWRNRPKGAWKKLCDFYADSIKNTSSLKLNDNRLLSHPAFRIDKQLNVHLSNWIREMGEGDDPEIISIGYWDRIKALPFILAGNQKELLTKAIQVLSWDALFTSTNSYKHGGRQVLAPALGNESCEYLFSTVDKWFEGKSLKSSPFMVLGKEGDTRNDRSNWSVITELFGFINIDRIPYVNNVNKDLFGKIFPLSSNEQNNKNLRIFLQETPKLVGRLASIFDGLKNEIDPPRTRIRGLELNTKGRLLEWYNEDERVIHEIDKIYDFSFKNIQTLNNDIDKACAMSHFLFDAHCYAEKDALDLDMNFEDDNEAIVRSEEKAKKLVATPSKHTKNLILCGPPGTGKTYSSIYNALQIIDGDLPHLIDESSRRVKAMERFNELRELGRIEFITFHQSFSYEDFVEGIRPMVDDVTEQVVYKVQPGLFKSIVDRIKKSNSGQQDFEVGDHANVWRVSLGDSGHFEECLNDNSIGINYDISDDITEIDLDDYYLKNPGMRGKSIVSMFRDQMSAGDLICIFNDASSIKAVGIITGDYYFDNRKSNYPTRRKVKWLDKRIHNISLLNGGKKMMTPAIHRLPNIDPGDLIDLISTSRHGEKTRKPYVLIIDEINRGNLSKIFGELITLLESDKREGEINETTVKLPYSGKPFSVPNNLYVIATMNTADRTIAMMDFALRRRFKFQYLEPNPALVPEFINSIPLRQLFTKLNERIEATLGRDYTIGHSFFMGVNTVNQLKEIWCEQILPLLSEYYYDDIRRLEGIIPGFIEQSSDLKLMESNFGRSLHRLVEVTDDTFEERLKKCA